MMSCVGRGTYLGKIVGGLSTFSNKEYTLPNTHVLRAPCTARTHGTGSKPAQASPRLEAPSPTGDWHGVHMRVGSGGV